MEIREIEELRSVLVAEETEELSSKGIDRLHHELVGMLDQQEILFAAKQLYSKRTGEVLKLLKSKIRALGEEIKER